ncbi:hypothetical protein C8R47DRAFT_1152397 [Mycena vitilis]|nr:hypothetical protein C8R47DRAFT_1152397 [Mycena vitilis]
MWIRLQISDSCLHWPLGCLHWAGNAASAYSTITLLQSFLPNLILVPILSSRPNFILPIPISTAFFFLYLPCIAFAPSLPTSDVLCFYVFRMSFTGNATANRAKGSAKQREPKDVTRKHPDWSWSAIDIYGTTRWSPTERVSQHLTFLFSGACGADLINSLNVRLFLYAQARADDASCSLQANGVFSIVASSNNTSVRRRLARCSAPSTFAALVINRHHV